jgi:hypothetical protein
LLQCKRRKNKREERWERKEKHRKDGRRKKRKHPFFDRGISHAMLTIEK